MPIGVPVEVSVYLRFRMSLFEARRVKAETTLYWFIQQIFEYHMPSPVTGTGHNSGMNNNKKTKVPVPSCSLSSGGGK